MRFVVGVIAVAPFIALLIAMASGRAKVQSCCSPPPVDSAATNWGLVREYDRQSSSGGGDPIRHSD